MPDFPFFPNIPLVVVLLAWTVVLTRRWLKKKENRAGLFLAISLLLVFVARWLFVVDVEANPDASTWLAVTLTSGSRPDPVYTLLSYADARPLTVLPLVLARALGLAPGYANAELVGVLCWLGTLALAYRVLRLQLAPPVSGLLVWALGLFVATVGYNDYIAYNSEHFGVLLLTAGTLAVLRLTRQPRTTWWTAGLLGLLLGCLPYEKLQLVPMGLVLAGAALLTLLRRRAWLAAGALVAGGVLPTELLVGFFADRGELDVFYNTYFWHYFYYAYSQEFSPMPLAQRFSPWRVVRFVFGNRQAVGYLLGQVLALGTGLWLVRERAQKTAFARADRRLSGLLLLASLYAVLQAGNPFTHYTWLLFVPLLLLVGAVVAGMSPRHQRMVLGLVLVTALGQALWNGATRRPLPPSSTEPMDARVVALIRANSRPGDPLLVWGYADRYHLLTDRPMGYRYANTFYVYAAYRAVEAENHGYFFEDLEKNRPIVFVDAMTPELSLAGQARFQHDRFPAVAAYVRRHYRLVGSVDGARVYRRVGME
jgi:hypothetical protein